QYGHVVGVSVSHSQVLVAVSVEVRYRYGEGQIARPVIGGCPECACACTQKYGCEAGAVRHGQVLVAVFVEVPYRYGVGVTANGVVGGWPDCACTRAQQDRYVAISVDIAVVHHGQVLYAVSVEVPYRYGKGVYIRPVVLRRGKAVQATP